MNQATSPSQPEESLRENLALQQLLMRMATKFVNVPIERIDKSIYDALEAIGTFVRADRAYLFKYDFARGSMSNTHEWCAEEISHEMKNSQNISNELLSDVVNAHRRGEVYVLPRVADLARDDAFRAILEPQGIQSLILFPMIYDTELLGFVGFDSVRQRRVFTETETVLLKVLAEILANTEMHRRSDESLRESEEKFRALVENTTDFIWEVDVDGKYTYASPQIHALLGFTPGEMIGVTPFDLMPPDEAKRVKKAFEEFSRDKRSINGFENINRHKDGHLVVMETSAIPILDKAGCLRGYRGIDRNVSERKHAEESLRLRSAALETAANAIAITNHDGIIQWINPAFTRLTGYDASEVVGQNPRILNSGMNDKGIFERLWKTILAGQSWQGEIINRKKDGTLYIIEQTVTHVRDLDGNISHFISVNQDITERAQAEALLRENEERLRLALSAASQGLYDLNVQNGEAIVSPEYAQMLGYDPDEFQETNQKWRERLHPDDRDEVYRAYEEYVAGKRGEYRVEFRQKTKTGEWKWILSLGKLVERDRDGRPLRMLGTHTEITERKQAIEELAAKERRYRALFNLSPAGIMLMDSSGVIIETNDAYCRSHQYSKDELVGQDIRLLVPAEGHAKVGDHLQRILSGETLDHEVVNLRKDGTECIIELRETSILLPDGRKGILSVANDITERKRAEDALRENEQKFRTVVQNAQAVVFILDSTGVFQLSDGQALKNLGLKPGQVVGLSALELYKDYPEVVNGITRALSGEVTRVTAEVQGLIFDTLYSPYLDRNGKLAGVVGVATDITERIRSEEMLRKSEERYRRFFEKDLTGIFISTPEGKILDCNPAYARIFGFASREEVLNTNAVRLYEGSEQRNAMLGMLRERKELQNIEMALRRIDGTKVHVFETIIGTFDNNGNLVQLMGYISDKTRQKQLEQQLMQSQKMESLGTLASGIAHDFNNILGIVLGHASLLTDARLTADKSAHHTSAILKATERGVGVVKQLLTFARKTDMFLEPVHINDIVYEFEKLLSETLPRTITIVTDLRESLPTVVADGNQMHQVILNLSVNARDAMPGGGKLTIATGVVSLDELRRTWREASAPSYVVLSVADTGTGIDDVTRERIFEPFFTTKERGKGTGLGLATVYGVVQTHKGWIDVQSQPGQGTVFSIYFPVHPGIAETRSSDVSNPLEVPGGNETILLVEDETMLQEMLAELLRAKGYSIITAMDGVQGLELYNQHSAEIALVISDLGLPRLGGDDLFAAIKSLNPTVKFILASGFVDPAIRAKLTGQGLHHIISKPYFPAHVLRIIREVIDAKG